jgi:hypothetical protein
LYADSPSTSTMSSRLSTTSHLLRRTLDAWDQLKLAWDTPNPPEESEPTEIGSRLTTRSSKRPRLSSHTESKNSATTENTLTVSSHRKWIRPTEGLSSTTPLSETKSGEDNRCYLPTEINSHSFTQPSSCPMVLNPISGNGKPPFSMEANLSPTSVDDIIPRMDAQKAPIAVTNTSAGIASDLATAKSIATAKAERVRGLQPKYLRYNLWSPEARTCSVADWTETAKPLPPIPLCELQNDISSQTIVDNPSLFKIVTPIKVDRFEFLLRNHPNQLFVQSVCKGLREGFWPWADTLKLGYPTTHDASVPMPEKDSDSSFLRSQRDIEVGKERFSNPFGPDLLPGMYSMPIHAVPKPHSTDLRMVTDQSAGQYSLNSMILHSDIAGYPLDNMKRLGEILLDIRKRERTLPSLSLNLTSLKHTVSCLSILSGKSSRSTLLMDFVSLTETTLLVVELLAAYGSLSVDLLLGSPRM